MLMSRFGVVDYVGSLEQGGKQISKQNKTYGRKLTRLTPSEDSVPSFPSHRSRKL